MNPAQVKKIRMLIAIILFLLFTYANVYIIRQMTHYGREMLFIDKMQVAFQTAGLEGLNKELALVLTRTDAPYQVKLARAFQADLKNHQDIGAYLERTDSELEQKLTRLKNFRTIAFVLILVIILLRVAVNRVLAKNKKKVKKHRN